MNKLYLIYRLIVTHPGTFAMIGASGLMCAAFLLSILNLLGLF